MPEGANVEIAHSLTEHHEDELRAHERWHRVLEVFEVFLLAIVAIATAWSGFQAAKWDGRQSFDYGTSNRLRFEADAAATAAGQELIADVNLFTAWLAAQPGWRVAGSIPSPVKGGSGNVEFLIGALHDG